MEVLSPTPPPEGPPTEPRATLSGTQIDPVPPQTTQGPLPFIPDPEPEQAAQRSLAMTFAFPKDTNHCTVLFIKSLHSHARRPSSILGI